MQAPPDSLDELRKENAKTPFPKFVLRNCDSALMLFCAGFYGKNDCVWVEQANVKDVTAVDTDASKLRVMQELYPPGWKFACADVYRFTVGATSQALKFDLVVADVPLTQFEYSKDWYKSWCWLSDRYVLITAEAEPLVSVVGLLPRDWKVKGTIQRTSQSSWLLLSKR
jgi:hypothetical protein